MNYFSFNVLENLSCMIINYWEILFELLFFKFTWKLNSSGETFFPFDFCDNLKYCDDIMVDSTDQNGSTAVTNNNSASFPGRRKKSRHDVIEDEQRERQLQPDPFTNNMTLDPFDWIVLGFGTILILPFRVLGVVFTMCLAWFVAKIGLFGIPEEELNSPLSKRSLFHQFHI